MENNLKKLRNDKGLYQKDIAKMLDIAVSTYSYWESGTNEPDQKSLIKLADYYGVTTDYILGRTSNLDEELIKKAGGFAVPDKFAIPLVGQVVAGIPVESPEYLEGYVYVGYKNAEEYFALKVKGDSMIGEGITEKSILIVHKQNHAENGDIVVAAIDGESTVKTYKENKGTIFLMPANPKYTPIVITPDNDFYIFGRVVEVRTQK